MAVQKILDGHMSGFGCVWLPFAVSATFAVKYLVSWQPQTHGDAVMATQLGW